MERVGKSITAGDRTKKFYCHAFADKIILVFDGESVAKIENKRMPLSRMFRRGALIIEYNLRHKKYTHNKKA